jgi:hypothetical protein
MKWAADVSHEIRGRCLAFAAPLAILVLVAGALLCPHPAVGQDSFVNYRELSEHTFIPASRVGDPFVASWVRSETGFGIAQGLQVPIRNPETGEILGTLEGDVAFISLGFEYQQLITRWLGLRVGGTASARTGTNEQSLLSTGINALYGFNLGTTVRILEANRIYLSAVGDLRWNQVYAFDLYGFLKKVIDEGFDPEGDNQLVGSGKNLVGSAGLRLAYTPTRLLGFTVLTEFGGADPFKSDQDSRGLVRLGGTVGLDLGATTSVPIGLLGGFKWENFNDRADDLADKTWSAMFSIGYTGRSDFYIGLESEFGRIVLVNRGSTGASLLLLRSEPTQMSRS